MPGLDRGGSVGPPGGGLLPNKGRGPSNSPTWGVGEAGWGGQHGPAAMPTPGPLPLTLGSPRVALRAPVPAPPPPRPAPTSFLPSPPLPHGTEGGGTGDITDKAGGAASRAHHFLGASRRRGQANRQWTVGSGQWTGDKRWAVRARGAQPRPSATPAHGRSGPARRRRAGRPGPAPLLQVGWADRAAGAAGTGQPGGSEQRRLQARNVAGTRPPCEAARVGARGRRECQRRARGWGCEGGSSGGTGWNTGGGGCRGCGSLGMGARGWGSWGGP